MNAQFSALDCADSPQLFAHVVNAAGRALEGSTTMEAAAARDLMAQGRGVQAVAAVLRSSRAPNDVAARELLVGDA